MDPFATATLGEGEFAGRQLPNQSCFILRADAIVEDEWEARLYSNFFF